MKRKIATDRVRLAVLFVVLLAMLPRISMLRADSTIIIDSRHQLFLDDHLIASMTRMKRTVERAEKFRDNPVLWPTESWEPPMATAYGSVIRDGDKFKIWYKSGMGVGYAESEDGIQWSKPRFDLTLIDGQQSNILFTKKSKTEGPDGWPYFYELFGVHRDDRDSDPARRYKMGSSISTGNTRAPMAIRGTKASAVDSAWRRVRTAFTGSS
jgi:hypothetical protein